LSTIDWMIVACLFVVFAFVAIKTKRYVQGVADFLAANRCAGPYLLTLADGMATVSAIGIIGSFQQTFEAGLGAAWWGGMMGPLIALLPLTGFIIYRFRESRVMTIAEFYEKRYSRRFRIFAGILASISGVINYGVFPSVTARFLICFCGIPEYVLKAGPFEVNITLGLVMSILLGTALTITFRGGQIAIMVTDFLQAQYLNVVFIVVIAALVYKFGFSEIAATLKAASAGKSMLNPFGQEKVEDFNVFFFIIAAFNVVYTYMAWQGNQGYNCSARTPHDAKMARILGGWRFCATWTIITLIPIFAYVFYHSPAFAMEADGARAGLAALSDEGLERELAVPTALRGLLPGGVLGLFAAAMLAASVSTDDTYLHSWGSILIQDVVMPFRKEPLAPAQHLRWLRRSILGVAVFVWLFGMVFPLREYIFMYWAITGAIYTGGAGSVIIGGFYWKRATTAGAWAGMTTGSVLGFTGVLTNNVLWPHLLPTLKAAYPGVTWLQRLPNEFWFNGMQLFFFACLAAITAYVVTSFLTKPKAEFDMDKLLRRGKYTIEGEHRAATERPKGFLALLGIDEEYTTFDKFVAVSIFAWTILWFTVFIIGTLYGLIFETGEESWARYWMLQSSIHLGVGALTVIWFLICGFRDLGDMLARIRTARRDAADDGFVEESTSNAELARRAGTTAAGS